MEEAALYRAFFEESLSVMLVIDPSTGEIVEANEAAARFYGYSAAQLRALRLTDINPLDAPALTAATAQAQAKQTNDVRVEHRLASGEVREVDVFSSPIEVGGRRLLASVVHDVTERRGTEQALGRRLTTVSSLRDANGAGVGTAAIANNFADRKPAEVALGESERKYRLLFENMTAAFALHEMVYDELGKPIDCRYLEVNPAFERLTGLLADQVLGRTVRELLPRTEDSWILAQARVATTGEALSYTHYAQDFGRYVDAFSFCPAPGRFAVVFTDVTERVEAEAALRRSEQDFRLLAENSRDLIVRLSPDLAVLYASPAIRRIGGFEPDTVRGQPALEFVHPEDRDVVALAVVRALERPVGETVTYRQLCADGTYVWVESTGHAIRDDTTGEVTEIQIATRDIAERKRAEDALRAVAAAEAEQARIAEALAEASAALASGLEPAGPYETILQQMARVVPCTTTHIFAYRDGWAVVVGAYGEPNLPPGSRVALLDGAEGLFPQSPEQARLLSETRGASGWQNLAPWVDEHEVRSTIVVPLIVHGETHGCLGVGSTTPGVFGPRDFQVVHAFAERLGQALWNARLYQLEQRRAREAEQLASLRSEFVATASHELRTPLAAALGYAEVLEGRWSQLTDLQRRQHVQRIVVATNRQKRLIDDLLRIGTLEAEQLTVRWQEVSLVEVVAHAMDVVNGSYPTQHIDAEGPPGLTAMGDPSHVEQVLTNLLDNAAKYSPEGSPIDVRWTVETGMVLVRVRDHGPGIPEAGRDILFSRFGRVPGSRTRAGHVGTGLGLYLGRALAEAMGGTLDLESTSERGSMFCLRLPVHLPDTGVAPGSAP